MLVHSTTLFLLTLNLGRLPLRLRDTIAGKLFSDSGTPTFLAMV